MKAVIHEGKAGLAGLSYGEIEKPEPGAGEVRVKLKTAGLNHRDLFVLNRHKPEDLALVIGSDGAGIIDAVGDGVADMKSGDEVIINPGLGWKEKSEAPPAGFEIVGLPFHGTFAEYIIIPAENAAPKPGYLTWEEAGVLSLAALTAYRALFTRGKLQAGMKVFIPGIGGGVATFLMQFAKAAGASVYVASRSEEKCRRALEIGADKALNSSEEWTEALGGEKVDLVIESVGPATFNKSLEILRGGGTIVTFGSSTGDVLELNLRSLFYAQQNMLGSTMGSAEEYHEMLHFIEKHQIRPVLDQAFHLEQYEQAFEKIANAEQWGKIAFKISE
ncbi:zinc-binding dehydrogenase [Cytobacillus oceanisediminis]|jgi:zinc-binding alcohol dehydrogenase/oxidoreductase|uniref:zinc-binding dehydrogenase n=1 Tax=Cytobacillus oceanisediminis TaxID=665099 RepID=UPI001D14ED24|nr:zinc-binding dehydrogenase [Cytobacillus oceanisediminis]MCC3649241.1 zinc-binding dehydrogenase [Cytobacillus oceanisediminis]